MQQIDQAMFIKALQELGHDPRDYQGQKISLDQMVTLYDFEKDDVLDAIEKKILSAHYDYKMDTIWVDALEAAHFYYCVRSRSDLFLNR